MNTLSRLSIIIFVVLLCWDLSAQTFPNPVTLSTGQGTPGTLDPLWTVSDMYPTIPPNPMGLAYTPALINNNCAPGSWVDPASLPPPVNNGNWITNTSTPCATNIFDGYTYFRLTLNLPIDCNGNGVTTVGSYVLNFSGYVDNTISDVFVNGVSMGISGGAFAAGSQLNFTLPGPWAPGLNYIDILVYNFPNGGQANPYGLLLVPNSSAPTIDSDGDGVADIDDACPCVPGNNPNGCPPLISGDTVICLGETTSLRTFMSGTYLWSTGATIDSIIVSPGNTTPYSLTVTQPSGLVHTATVNVTVNALPNAAISPAVAAICFGDNITLTASGGTGYVWDDGTTNPSITVAPTVTTPYSVTVTDGNGCVATVSRTVTVNALPVPVINPSVAAVCLGDNIILTASGGATYVWDNSQGTAAITVSPIVNTSYSVTVTDVNNCSASTSRAVTVNPLPMADISPATAIICIGDNITLTASGATGFEWSTGLTSAAITVSPATNTPYTVTVTDANNCTASTTRNVTVNPLPVPTISPTVAEICLGDNITLTASGAIGYAWDNGDLTAATTVSPIANTTYTVTVTDANNCSASTSRNVTVHALPVATISPAVATICLGDNIALTASGGASYVWDNSQATAAITESPMVNSTYSVTVTDANNCTASTSRNVTVNPVHNLTVNDAICNGDNYQLPGGTVVTSSGTYIDTLANQFGCDSIIETQLTVNPVYRDTLPVTICGNDSYSLPDGTTVNQAGFYTSNLQTLAGCDSTIVTDLTVISIAHTVVYDTICAYQTYTMPAGRVVDWSDTFHDTIPAATNCDSIVTVHLYVIDLTMSLTAKNLLCNGDATGTLTATDNGGINPITYQWSDASFTGNNISNVAAATYTATATDAFGCTATQSIDVTEPAPLVLTTEVVDVSCFGANDGNVRVLVQGGTADYEISLNGTVSQSGYFDELPLGSYTTTGIDANGCTVTDSAVVAEPDAFELFSQPDSFLLELGDTLELEVSSNFDPITVYDWNAHPSVSCDDCTNPTVKLYDTDTLLLTTSYLSSNQNATCYNYHMLPIVVLEKKNLFIPNAFSPNADGQNDEYRIYGNLKGLRIFNIKIFDRYGEKVFESSDPFFVWQGTFKGQLLTGGVYVYVVRYAWHSGWEIMNNDKGSLTIIR